MLNRCRTHNIVMSKKKFAVGERVFFAGCVITGDGIYPDPAKTQAIRDFPVPKNKTDLRSFLGLAQQLGHYHPDLAHLSAALRPLLKKESAWNWLEAHTTALKAVKGALIGEHVLKPFDPKLNTVLLTDASRLYGIGWALMQVEPGGHRLIQCGSRGLTDAQTRYCVTSLECMAIHDAILKNDFYLKGLPHFECITDHRPLVEIFKQDLERVAIPRCQRYRERLSVYSFTVKWLEGKSHLIADALSRYPAFSAEQDMSEQDEDRIVCRRLTLNPAMELITDAAKKDEHYKQCIEALKDPTHDGKFSKGHPCHELSKFWHELGLTEVNDVTIVTKSDSQIFVPREVRQKVLQTLHRNHAGMVKCKNLARQIYFWPGMGADIEDLIMKCDTCLRFQPSQQRPQTVAVDHDTLPGTHMGVDLAEFNGKDWIIAVDRYSGFPFAAQLRKTNTEAVTDFLERVCLEWGRPLVIRSDQGPQFRQPFDDWCFTMGIIHETSSPYNPESNGLAEAAVKNVKKIIKECHAEGVPGDFQNRLQRFRNEPRADGFSPCQRFIGRRQRTDIATLSDFLKPMSISEIKRADESRIANEEAIKSKVDARARTFDEITKGQHVAVQCQKTNEWTERGIIKGARDSGSSFIIELSNGKEVTRNRKYIRPLRTHDTPPAPEEREQEQPRGPRHLPVRDLSPARPPDHVDLPERHLAQAEPDPAPPRRSARILERDRRRGADDADAGGARGHVRAVWGWATAQPAQHAPLQSRPWETRTPRAPADSTCWRSPSRAAAASSWSSSASSRSCGDASGAREGWTPSTLGLGFPGDQETRWWSSSPPLPASGGLAGTAWPASTASSRDCRNFESERWNTFARSISDWFESLQPRPPSPWRPLPDGLRPPHRQEEGPAPLQEEERTRLHQGRTRSWSPGPSSRASEAGGQRRLYADVVKGGRRRPQAPPNSPSRAPEGQEIPHGQPDLREVRVAEEPRASGQGRALPHRRRHGDGGPAGERGGGRPEDPPGGRPARAELPGHVAGAAHPQAQRHGVGGPPGPGWHHPDGGARRGEAAGQGRLQEEEKEAEECSRLEVYRGRHSCSRVNLVNR